MNRIDDVNILIPVGKAAQGAHDVLHRLAVVFAAVRRDENHTPAVIIQSLQRRIAEHIVRTDRGVNRVDNRVATHENTVRDSLCRQIAPVALGRSKMK